MKMSPTNNEVNPPSPENNNDNCGICKIACQADEKALECDGCSIWFHIKCHKLDEKIYDFYSDNMVSEHGFPWFCNQCSDKITIFMESVKNLSILETTGAVASRPPIEAERAHTSPPTVQAAREVARRPSIEDERAHTSPPTSLAATSRINKDVSTQSLDDSSTKKVHKQEPELQKPTCYYYRKGRCRHGSSGKKTVNGRKCLFLHPQKCSKFCRFGRDRAMGCNGSCGLFHPTLCPDSVEYGRCSIPECTLAHLFGTEKSFNKMTPRSYNEGNLNSNFRAVDRHAGYMNKSFQPHYKHGFFAKHSHNAGRFPYNNRQNYPSIQQRDDVAYQSHDFPTPIDTNEVKISQLSSSIQQIQKSIEFLMQCSANNSQQNFGNHRNPYMDNQFSNTGQPQPMSNINPMRNEAKN